MQSTIKYSTQHLLPIKSLLAVVVKKLQFSQQRKIFTHSNFQFRNIPSKIIQMSGKNIFTCVNFSENKKINQKLFDRNFFFLLNFESRVGPSRLKKKVSIFIHRRPFVQWSISRVTHVNKMKKKFTFRNQLSTHLGSLHKQKKVRISLSKSENITFGVGEFNFSLTQNFSVGRLAKHRWMFFLCSKNRWKISIWGAVLFWENNATVESRVIERRVNFWVKINSLMKRKQFPLLCHPIDYRRSIISTTLHMIENFSCAPAFIVLPSDKGVRWTCNQLFCDVKTTWFLSFTRWRRFVGGEFDRAPVNIYFVGSVNCWLDLSRTKSPHDNLWLVFSCATMLCRKVSANDSHCVVFSVVSRPAWEFCSVSIHS